MKQRNYTTSFGISLIVALFAFSEIKAQEGDFTEIFRGAPEDATTYLEGYIGPAMLSFSNGMAGGWYNTAKTHKPLGLDLNFSMNIANMPTSERQFIFNSNAYNLLQVQGTSPGTDVELPTLVGGPTNVNLEVVQGVDFEFNGVTYQYDVGRNFDPIPAPPGIDIEDVPFVGVPVPTLQLGIGLFKNTDLKLRFIPEQTFNTFDDDTGNDSRYSVKLFGIGILHDIKQWIPGIRQVPMDISVFFGTTKMTTDFTFEAGDPTGVDKDWYVTNGLAEFSVTATTFQVIASKKISFFTPYIGVGINSVNTSFEVNGDYTLFSLIDVTNPANFYEYKTVTGNEDPIRLDFTGGGGIRTTVGFRLKLFVLTLNTDYTFQKYNTFTLGLGFTFRENK